MKQKWNHSLTALLLAFALVLTMPLLALQTARAVDLSKECSLTIKSASYEQEMIDAGLQLNLYKIADAVPDPTYDTYSYNLADGVVLSKDISSYESLAKLENDDWTDMAQDAAKSVLVDKTAADLDMKTTALAEQCTDLSAGLYLIAGDSVEKNEEGNWVSKFFDNKGAYSYSFLPELVSLPSTSEDVSRDQTDGNMTTASGEWAYNIIASIKPEQKPAFGDLEIRKELTTYNSNSPVTFVFEIEATLNGETVYSDVVGLTFSKAGVRTARIEGKIPVGADVTVTEVYSGSSYKVEGNDTRKLVIIPKDEGTSQATFENKFDEHNRKGYGIVNKFSIDEEYKLKLKDKEHDSAEE